MRKLLILLLFSSLFLSCNEDDDALPPVNTALNGSWNMETYVAFMAELPELNDGDITWTFNSNNTVTVVNNVEEQYPYMMGSGVYSFTIEGNLVTLLNDEPYQYTINGTELTLAHTLASVDGGPIISFSKN